MKEDIVIQFAYVKKEKQWKLEECLTHKLGIQSLTRISVMEHSRPLAGIMRNAMRPGT